MPPIIVDSSLYVSALRTVGTVIFQRNTDNEGPIWLSAVVLAELLAGARERSAIAAVEKLEQDFRNARRLLVPAAADWSKSGRILARIAGRFDYELRGQFRLLNDVLIAASASRIGATLITLNARDFARIAEFTPLTWRVSLP